MLKTSIDLLKSWAISPVHVRLSYVAYFILFYGIGSSIANNVADSTQEFAFSAAIFAWACYLKLTEE